MEKNLEIFVTKYALTDGIFKVLGTILEEKYVTRRASYIREGSLGRQYVSRTEFHFTLEEAIQDAEKRRLEKIASLKKKMEKLEKMKFDKYKECK